MKSVSINPSNGGGGTVKETLSLPGLFIVVQTSQPVARTTTVTAEKKKKTGPGTSKPKKKKDTGKAKTAVKVKKTAGKKTATAPKKNATTTTTTVPKGNSEQAKAFKRGLAEIKKFLKK